MCANRSSIGEGWEFEKQMMNMSTQLNSSNNVDVSTSAQLLPMQCCVQYGLELNKIYNESNL